MRSGGGERTISITPATRRYLAAFDLWLHEVWAAGLAEDPDVPNLVMVRKDKALCELLTASACRRCGGHIVNARRGRPRKYCRKCRPPYAAYVVHQVAAAGKAERVDG